MDIQMRKFVRKILKKDKRMERLKRSFEEHVQLASRRYKRRVEVVTQDTYYQPA